MDDDQQFCLRWNNHQSTLISVFDTLLENGTLVDCTLAAEGKFLKAHKVVLCACSPYFASLLSQQYDKHPIFILKDVKFQELRAMMDYMYRGEVNISQDQLAALLKAAESLQIKGLSDNRGGSSAKGVDNAQQKQQVPVSGSAAGSAAKTGLTIEQNNKRPNAELPGDREGSTSPLSRKRKRVRRRSVDTNNAVATIDNHDQMSNSSSQSATQQAQPITSTPLTLSQITTATSAANVLNVTKKTDNNSNDDDDDDDDEEEPTIVRHKTRNTDGSNKDKIDSELLIEPKSEYEDGNDETVEDLTMADEELMEDMEQAGPSHGGEGSSQGYTQWQVDRSQDEVYLATQEAGQHRDAQDKHQHDDKQLEYQHKAIDENTATSENVEISNVKSPTMTSNSNWPQRIQSMVVQNDGSIILCENESELNRRPHIEVVEILSPTNYISAPQPIYDQMNPKTNESDVKTNTMVMPTSNVAGKQKSNTGVMKKRPLHMMPKLENSQSLRFNCPRCGKDYSQRKNMRRHYRLECGQEPKYPCPVCNLRFKRHNQMSGHMLTRHGIRDVGAYEI